MKQSIPAMKDYSLGDASFIKAYASATGVSEEDATLHLNQELVRARAKEWNVSEVDAWERLVKESGEKKAKRSKRKFPIGTEGLKAIGDAIVLLLGLALYIGAIMVIIAAFAKSVVLGLLVLLCIAFICGSDK